MCLLSLDHDYRNGWLNFTGIGGSTYPEYAVKETGGKIPKDFHTNQDGFLCLGSSLAIKEAFNNKPNLLGFVEKVVIPFFYSFSYWEKYNEMPHGELPHGTEGILFDYKNRFGLSSDIEAMKFLHVLVENSYRGHNSCPCESGKRFRDCHGKRFLEIQQLQEKEEFLIDFILCHELLIGKGLNLPDFKTPRIMNFIKTLKAKQILKRK